MMSSPQRTALYTAHRARTERFVPFAGWEMPLQYEGIMAEHRAVRSGVGIFDVSHLGRLLLEGPGVEACLDTLVPGSLEGLTVGRGRYAILCDEQGGILDDLIIYRQEPERTLLVINATPFAQMSRWILDHAHRQGGVAVQDITASTAMIAVQGPSALTLAAGLLSGMDPVPDRYAFVRTRWQGREAWVARTGYTGEDGVEVTVPAESAHSLWGTLLERGATPCGLGARDSLRLEAGLLLSGQDFDRSVNPWEAGLERLVDLEKGGFVGREALLRAQNTPLSRRLVGFRMVERAVPRSGCSIAVGAATIGQVTSGGYAPMLDAFVGLAYVPPNHASVGARWEVEVRGRRATAEVVRRPFYRRPRP